MKTILINGSPRRNWNTYKLLKEAEKGAKAAGAETEFVQLYDLDYKGCRSCFECKLRDNQTNGICAQQDALRPILQSCLQADSIIIGSPIYFGHLTGATLSFMERMIFPLVHYEIDLSWKHAIMPNPKQIGLIVTMNAAEDHLEVSGYSAYVAHLAKTLEGHFGHCETLCVCDTYQFRDYSKYYASIFNVEQKTAHKEKQFPIDKQRAFDLGQRLSQPIVHEPIEDHPYVI